MIRVIIQSAFVISKPGYPTWAGVLGEEPTAYECQLTVPIGATKFEISENDDATPESMAKLIIEVTEPMTMVAVNPEVMLLRELRGIRQLLMKHYAPFEDATPEQTAIGNCLAAISAIERYKWPNQVKAEEERDKMAEEVMKEEIDRG